MQSVLYLTQRREIFFFRRRLPELSTELSPILVSLGTTDRRLACKLCMRLTAHMDQMLDARLHIDLPSRTFRPSSRPSCAGISRR
ncbi:DUF6538 domain-containing protein [Salipiger sp. IMCC34102]|uniref:DUF6538 domain-containing protein n=1 Tax=Salipiger sp. IMCC34102 TaxID=2510647 RepID=UPI00351432C5